MGKITLLNHLKACAEAAKNFTNGLVGELAQSVTDALEEHVEKRLEEFSGYMPEQAALLEIGESG